MGNEQTDICRYFVIHLVVENMSARRLVGHITNKKNLVLCQMFLAQNNICGRNFMQCDNVMMWISSLQRGRFKLPNEHENDITIIT